MIHVGCLPGHGWTPKLVLRTGVLDSFNFITQIASGDTTRLPAFQARAILRLPLPTMVPQTSARRHSRRVLAALDTAPCS
jgi:hypothetical protein